MNFNRLKQLSSQTARIVAWLLGSVFGLSVLAILVFAWLMGDNQPSPHRGCVKNLWRCHEAILLYVADHDDRLPRATSWMDDLSPYVESEKVFRCYELEAKNKEGFGYAMNFELSSYSIIGHPNLDKTPVLFDSILLARNATSGFYGFPSPKERRLNVLFLDGGVRPLKINDKGKVVR